MGLKLLREARSEIIGGLVVAAVLAVIRTLHFDRAIWTIILIVIGCIFGGCVYVVSKRTPPVVEGGRGVWKYPRLRPWALAALFIILLLTAGGIGYHFYQKVQPPTKVILLIANFDGPDPQKYRVTETVLARLRQALSPYNDVKVEALGRAIIETEGSAVARAEGEKRKATIVLWGWYGATAEAVPLSVHFEVLRPPKHMP